MTDQQPVGLEQVEWIRRDFPELPEWESPHPSKDPVRTLLRYISQQAAEIERLRELHAKAQRHIDEMDRDHREALKDAAADGGRRERGDEYGVY